jgi:hypothetical protein
MNQPIDILIKKTHLYNEQIDIIKNELNNTQDLKKRKLLIDKLTLVLDIQHNDYFGSLTTDDTTHNQTRNDLDKLRNDLDELHRTVEKIEKGIARIEFVLKLEFPKKYNAIFPEEV